MKNQDLILLHAPSIYDFRKKPILFGPVSDVVPSTQIFEMYPIGFLTMLEYLTAHGYSVRIANLALRMLNRRKFSVPKFIKGLKPLAFGIDLHWMVHAQGSLEVAKIIKEFHPDIPVIFGGLSSSFFHEELIQNPQVDYVIRGDSAEEPLKQLMDAIKAKKKPDMVNNLTWRDESGKTVINKLVSVPKTIDDISFDYRSVMRATVHSTLKNFDFFGHMPFKSWLKYPIVAALTCRGCVHNCIICGGSSEAYQNICKREKPAFRSPEMIADDISLISKYINAPIILLGDLLQNGRKNTEQFLNIIKERNIKNHIALEFFSPPDKELIDMAGEAFPNFNIQISPESHDEKVRKAFGRNYTNAQLEKFIPEALNAGCKRIDIFFMIGLPHQTAESVSLTIDYCRKLIESYGTGPNTTKIHPFISPLAPFLDPGSKAFLDPGAYGYRMFAKTLEDHIKALQEPSWKYTLNYETEWMSRDEIVDATYDSSLRLNSLKGEFGLISGKEMKKIQVRIKKEWEMIKEIDHIRGTGTEEELNTGMRDLMKRFDYIGPATICKKDEMNWPTRFLRFNPFRILKYLIGLDKS